MEGCILFINFPKTFCLQNSDVIGYSKKGKKITVQMACIRKMNKLINRKTRDRYRNISFEALTRKSEPTVEMKEEVKQDYEQCDKIVDGRIPAVSFFERGVLQYKRQLQIRIGDRRSFRSGRFATVRNGDMVRVVAKGMRLLGHGYARYGVFALGVRCVVSTPADV